MPESVLSKFGKDLVDRYSCNRYSLTGGGVRWVERKIKSFEDLDVWQLCRDLRKNTDQVGKKLTTGREVQVKRSDY